MTEPVVLLRVQELSHGCPGESDTSKGVKQIIFTKCVKSRYTFYTYYK